MYKIFLSLLVFVQVAAYAQTGTLKGIASDSTNAEALIGAVVSVVDNNAIGGVTDVDGSFLIENIPAGTYNFKISYLGYNDRIITGVTIQSGQVTDLGTLTMASESSDVTEVTVIGVREKASEAAVVQEIREADQVVSGISSEQISKGQDRDAAQVVQRIPGVSVVDNRFIMIRGLNDRYNTVWLNDVTAPSLEADRKAFSFDAVPSSIIERVLVYKTPSPELPGDYAGGLVKIYTKTPQRKSFNVGVTLGARNGTTFSPFTKDKSPTDFLGFDSGQRKLPNVPSQSNSNLSDADGQKFDNTASSRQTKNASPDIRIGLNYTNVFDVLNKKLGVITSLNYSNVNTTYSIRRQDSDLSGLIGVRTEKEYTNQARLGAILNFSLILNEHHKFEFRNFFIQNGINQSVDRSVADAHERVYRKQYTIGYSGRTIYTTQIAGKHENKNTFFDWTIGYSLSGKSDPDQRRAIYNVDQTTGVESIQPATSGSDINAGTSRFYQKLTENAIVGSANFTQKFKLFNDKLALDLNLGTYLESKSREFKARVFGYTVPNPGSINYQTNIIHQGVSTIFNPANVSFANGFSIAEDVKGAYTYQGLNQLSAFYASVNLAFGNFKVLTGVRYENNIQNIKTKNDADQPLNINNTTNYFLPSLNVSYNLTERQLVRVAYGKSLNRPEFREKVPFTFYQFATLSALSGNPDLKVASINNYDIRYEFYPTQEEVISLAGFYKDITDAIESVSLNTAQLTYSYQNAHSAYIAGIELEVKKNLGFVSDATKDFSLLLNASLIKSEVTLPVQGGFYWDNQNKRPLQGQSPYVINAGLYYQNDDNGWSASVLYNIFGPRIVTVGNGNYANVIETPRSTLDATITKNINRFSITAGAVDIFNQSVIYIQNFSANGNYSRKEGDNSQLMNYRKGNYFTLSLRYNL